MKERRASFRRDATSGLGAKKPPDASRTNRRLSRLCGILIARARRTGDRPERRVIEANEWCSTAKTLVRARSFDEGATDGFGKRTRARTGTVHFFFGSSRRKKQTSLVGVERRRSVRLASRPGRRGALSSPSRASVFRRSRLLPTRSLTGSSVSGASACCSSSAARPRW